MSHFHFKTAAFYTGESTLVFKSMLSSLKEKLDMRPSTQKATLSFLLVLIRLLRGELKKGIKGCRHCTGAEPDVWKLLKLAVTGFELQATALPHFVFFLKQGLPPGPFLHWSAVFPFGGASPELWSWVDAAGNPQQTFKCTQCDLELTRSGNTGLIQPLPWDSVMFRCATVHLKLRLESPGSSVRWLVLTIQ